MDSREDMMPKAETIIPEATVNYQLAPRNNSSNLLIGPPGYSSVSGAGIPASLVKKKRGRPRKYGPDGVATGSGRGESGATLSPRPISASGPPPSVGYSEVKLGEEKKMKMSSPETKPKHTYGSVDLGDRISSGGSFIPHMVTVNPGEVVDFILNYTSPTISAALRS